MDGKVLCFYKKSNNSKAMETTKEEMMQFLRELQDLQIWLLNSGRKFSLIIRLYGNIRIYASVVGLTYRGVNLSNMKPFNDNVANLKDFIDFVKSLNSTCASMSNEDLRMYIDEHTSDLVLKYLDKLGVEHEDILWGDGIDELWEECVDYLDD